MVQTKDIERPGKALVEGLSMPDLPPSRRARILANDLEALRASIDRRISFPLMAPDALSQPIPMLFFAGEDDPLHDSARTAVEEATSCTFISVPGRDHVSAITDFDYVAPCVRRFLDRVSEG